jgi:dTDP-4-dehydrorhamnose reductase
MRAFIAGATGQLGRELVRLLGERVVFAGGSRELDVRDGDAVARIIRGTRPNVVFNASAFNDVDGAETSPHEAFAVNSCGPLHLARAAAENGALFVHVSTDYVFDGNADSPYTEDDTPHPISVYGATKLAGEQLVEQIECPSLIVRTSGLFGAGGSRIKGGSFVDRVLAKARTGKPLMVVGDQVFSPTYAPDLAAALLGLIQKSARGLFHVSNGGAISWHGLAVAALEQAGLKVEVKQIRTLDLGARARRPAHSVLSKERFTGLGIAPLRSWRDALEEYMVVLGARPSVEA